MERDATSRTDPPDDDLPSPARAFDFLLGGDANTLVDREFIAAARVVLPDMAPIARDVRTFSRAVVGHLAASGIDQFLEIGSGLPTVRPVHEVAPGARVVYVDVDDRTVEHARRLLPDRPGLVALQGDVRDVPAILADPAFRRTIDLARPLGVLLIGLLHYVEEAEARRALRELHAAVVPGSVVAVNAITDVGRPDITDWVAYSHQGLSYPPRLRPLEELAQWLADWEILPPGWVSAPHWVPDDAAVPGPAETRSAQWGVVARRV
ncbi:SAM-dependent methyltransferase [Actinomycetospora atypica]|uniref:SAM-dependent methyltransferase n=1 Tax=Actinomycetospora atypica TaxID=1290095 RepID=A0ABV9YVA0_9PSEU